MHILDAIFTRRSIRKFKQVPVLKKDLFTLVEAARMAATAANMQPLKFAIIDKTARVEAVFPHIKWAGYLPDWNPTPEEGPASYIAILGDTKIKTGFEVDAGSAIATMMLAAEGLGLSTCWLGAIDREALKEVLGFDDTLQLLYLLAVGYGDQESRVFAMENNDCKYRFDADGALLVPKRSMDELCIELDNKEL